MEFPCPVPLTNAWSPVGYQVVDVTDAQEPVPGAAKTPAPVPSSPLGYRIVLVAEEKAKPVAVSPAPQPRPRTRARANSPKHDTTAVWAPLAVAGVFLVLFVIGALMFLSRPTINAVGPRAVWVNQPAEQVELVALPEIVLPEELAPQPAPAQPEAALNLPKVAAPAPEEKGFLDVGGGPDENGCAACEVDAKLSKRETFGTAVGFVRNPPEAARSARAEHKLMFLLHVSGNFEDARFT
jgi:hypothetical protein